MYHLSKQESGDRDSKNGINPVPEKSVFIYNPV